MGDIEGVGNEGPPGPPGEKGDKGDQGLIGPQGLKGNTGDKGDKGDQGIPGNPGIDGTNGIDGAPGAPGAPGAKGDKGDRGDVGPIGPQGIQGVKGDTGDPGAQGVPGAAGAQGVQGIQGVKGDTGAAGAAGAAGATGAQGAQGIQGVKGDTGAVGPQGPKGDPGTGGAAGPQYKGDWNAVTAYSAGDVVKYNSSLWEAQSAITAGTTPSTSNAATLAGGNAIDGAGVNNFMGGAAADEVFTVNANVTVSEVEFYAFNGPIPSGTTFEIRNAAGNTVLASGVTTAAAPVGTWGKAAMATPVVLAAGTSYDVRLTSGNVGTKPNPATPNGVVSALGLINNTYNTFSLAFRLNKPVSNPWSKMVSETAWTFMETFDADLSNYTDVLNKSLLSIAASKLTHVASSVSGGIIIRRNGVIAADLVQTIKINPASVVSGDCNVALLSRMSTDNLSWLQCNINANGGGAGNLQMYKNSAGTVTSLNTTAIAFNANTDYWLVTRLTGKIFKGEFWTSDPRAGGSPAYTLSYTLTDPELAQFATGGVGVRTYSAANTKYDEHAVRTIDVNQLF